MELKDFVKESLTQIVSGVKESQSYLSSNNIDGEICPKIKTKWEDTGLIFSESGKPIQNVDFDVSISVSEKKDSKGTIGIVVSSIGLGGQKSKESTAGNQSRIKFTIPITLPNM